jgi:ribosome biogenesis protein Tsr3
MKKCSSKKIAKFEKVALNSKAKKAIKGGQAEVIIQEIIDC